MVDDFTPNSSPEVIPHVDDAANSFENNNEFARLDASVVNDEAKDISQAIFEERRRVEVGPQQQSSISTQVGAEASEMGRE